MAVEGEKVELVGRTVRMMPGSTWTATKLNEDGTLMQREDGTLIQCIGTVMDGDGWLP